MSSSSPRQAVKTSNGEYELVSGGQGSNVPGSINGAMETGRLRQHSLDRSSFNSKGTYGSFGTSHNDDDSDGTEGLLVDDSFAPCTVFETTCNLVSVLTGSGMLSLPYAAAQAGCLTILFVVVLAAIFMYSFQLLAKCVETRYTKECPNHSTHLFYYNIDYLTFGRLTFGSYGDTLVLLVLGSELLLALVSFLMNIGLNLHTIHPHISVLAGTLISAAVSAVLALANLKIAAYSSVVGLVLTCLIIGAIIISGLQLESQGFTEANHHSHHLGRNLLEDSNHIGGSIYSNMDSGTFSAHTRNQLESSMHSMSSSSGGGDGGSPIDWGQAADPREYSLITYSGIPVSLGLIAFCFGGHGVFPKMYSCMRQRHRYKEVMTYTAIIVFLTYAVIMCGGYYFFAQYTKTPVTLNIGRDLHSHTTKHGSILKIAAAVGVICNLQVTCPLMAFPIRDMCLKMMSIHDASLPLQRLLAVLIVGFATLLAITLNGHFAALCGLVGSFATITNSILLPVLFYNTIHGPSLTVHTRILHGLIVCIAVTAGISGICTDVHNIVRKPIQA